MRWTARLAGIIPILGSIALIGLAPSIGQCQCVPQQPDGAAPKVRAVNSASAPKPAPPVIVMQRNVSPAAVLLPPIAGAMSSLKMKLS